MYRSGARTLYDSDLYDQGSRPMALPTMAMRIWLELEISAAYKPDDAVAPL